MDKSARGRGKDSHQTSRQKDDGVDNTDDPFTSFIRIVWRRVKAELLRERQVCAVRPSLIPTLRCSSDSTETDGVPEHGRAVPFVRVLIRQRLPLIVTKFGHLVEFLGIASDEGSAAEELDVLRHAIVSGKSLGIVYDLFFGCALQFTSDVSSLI